MVTGENEEVGYPWFVVVVCGVWCVVCGVGFVVGATWGFVVGATWGFVVGATWVESASLYR